MGKDFTVFLFLIHVFQLDDLPGFNTHFSPDIWAEYCE